jgi:hypothetical protein
MDRKGFLFLVALASSLAMGCDKADGGNDGGSGGSNTGGDNSGGATAGGTGPTGTASTSSSTTSTEFQAYCDDRAALCGNNAAVCKTQEACALGYLRDSIESSLFQCLAQSCDEEVCLSAATSAPTAADDATKAKCITKVDDCQLGDDICFIFPLITVAKVSDYDACLGKNSCAEVEACMDAVTDTLNACEEWL